MDLENIQRKGIKAAYKAGESIRSYLGNLSEIGKKGAIDLVTQADISSEKIIIETIKEFFPDHGILAEESGASKGDSDLLWIIDPLDGTTNFAHQLGIFAVSIAFAEKGELKVGVVLNPITGELFSGIDGCGAFLNGNKIITSNTKSISESLLITGFPYNLKEILEPLIARFKNCLYAAQGVRRLGSAAIDLCYLACGRFDGYWELNLNPWDTAAGVVIAKEAGAVITDFNDKPFSIYEKEILATNGNIHKEMISLLKL